MPEKTFVIPEEVLKTAYALIEEFDPAKWPEDDWFGLSDDYDLNMWDPDEKLASIYPVYNGQTDGLHSAQIVTGGKAHPPIYGSD